MKNPTLVIVGGLLALIVGFYFWKKYISKLETKKEPEIKTLPKENDPVVITNTNTETIIKYLPAVRKISSRQKPAYKNPSNFITD